MNNRLSLEVDELQGLLTDAKLGWWKADFKRKTCIFSQYISGLLGIESKEMNVDSFFCRVREDYRTRIEKEFATLAFLDNLEQTFPLYTTEGLTWVYSKLCRKETDKAGNTIATGIMQCISSPEAERPDQTDAHRINNLLYQQNSISFSLLSILNTTDTTRVIEKILGDILKEFCGGRAYIFEFDIKNGTQSCTYEVVEKGITAEKESLQSLPMNPDSWWTRQMLANNPIALFSLDELPPESPYDREVLEAQNIRSIMAVPMISREGVWAYMGIDIVNGHRKWSNEDYQWFSSMANITNICLQLRRSEQEAQLDRQFLSNLYKFMPVGYIRFKVIFDEEGIPVDYIFVDINDMADKLLGIKNLIGKLGSKFHIGSFEDSIDNFKEVFRTGSFLELNFRLAHKDKYCHAILYSPRKGEIISMFSDMTDTFKAHEALDRSEKMLRNIYNNIPVGIELYDKDGNLTDFNDRNLEIFGIEDKAEIMHLNLFQGPRFSEGLRKKLHNHEKLDFSYLHDYSKQQWHSGSRNQERAHLITKMTPLYDSRNTFTNYLVINIDNTETTSAYRKIQEFEEFFSVIADFAKVGYFKWNPLTEKGFAINQWYKNVGEPVHKSLNEIIGVYQNYYPDERKAINDFIRQATQGLGTELSREVRVKQPDGSCKWLRCYIMAKEYDPENDKLEMVGVNYDITELKEAEEKLIAAKDKAEALDRLKSAFLANMSHEIRTPLNAIVGFSSLLMDTKDVEEKKQYITIVQENNQLLLQLISDILDLAKIEAGTFEFIKETVDVGQLCQEIICSFSLKADDQVKIALGNPLPECHVYGDKNRLTQIINNFLTNAVKFTSKGSITLSYRLNSDRSEVEFSVTDTGIGIPPEKQEAVFGRFVKLDNFVHGTGLGLSICKSIAEQMGGRIGVESEVGTGSRFWFTHPNLMTEHD